MIRGLCAVLLVLATPTHEQSTPISPCPNVFSYEPPGTEPGRWYGVVNLSTDSTLHSLWLNIVLDTKADILGNWVGDVSTSDNIDFKIENTDMKINPGPAVAVRFFVQYNQLSTAPRLQAIRLNGREICNANTPQPAGDRQDNHNSNSNSNANSNSNSNANSNSNSNSNSNTRRPYQGTTSTSRPTARQTQKPAIKPEDRPHTRPVEGTNRPSGDGPVYVRPQTQTPLQGGGLSIDDSSHISQSTNNRNKATRPPYTDDSSHISQSTNNRNKATRPPYTDDSSHISQSTNNRNKATRPPYTDGGELSSQSTNLGSRPYGYDFTPTPPRRVTTVSKPDDKEYFDGGPNLFLVDSKGGSSNNNKNTPQQQQCGMVTLNNPVPLVVNGTPTLEGQWPWQIALYQTQTVDNKYICGGTLVSHRHIITAAHCVTKKGSTSPVLKNTLTVYLGKHNLRTSVDGVQIRFVDDIIIQPNYNATIFSRDIAILRLREPVVYTDWVRPACLWPDNQLELSNVVGKRGSVVGWGYDDTGVATEELSLVEMPIVSQETCIRSYSEFFVRFTSAYTFCAGFRDGTSVCNGDSGGGMVFRIGSAWYVRGLVSVSVARENEYRCDPSHYVIFTDIAKFLPWIRENVNDY